jgi:hypothetical protein
MINIDASQAIRDGLIAASMMSVELGISVALLELGLGVVAGNVFGLDPNTARSASPPRARLAAAVDCALDGVRGDSVCWLVAVLKLCSQGPITSTCRPAL